MTVEVILNSPENNAFPVKAKLLTHNGKVVDQRDINPGDTTSFFVYKGVTLKIEEPD